MSVGEVFALTGPCDYGHGCSRQGVLRDVVRWTNPPVPLYGCRWHVAAMTRRKKSQAKAFASTEVQS